MSEEVKEVEVSKEQVKVALAGLLGGINRERASFWLKVAGIIAAGTAGSLTLLVGAASYPLSSLLVRPRMKRVSQLNSPRLKNFIHRLAIPFEDISFISFDGTRLHGWWLEAEKDAPTIIMIHGVSKNRTDLLRAAITLRQANINVALLDGRAHGHSEGTHVTYGFYERRDVETLVDWLGTNKNVRKEQIGLAGESMGAAIALQVAAHNDWIRCVWADSPFASLSRVSEEFIQSATGLPASVLIPLMWSAKRVANYRGKFDIETIEPARLAAQIKCPVFLIHGTADQLISIEHSKEIYNALLVEKELWIVEGIRHARAARHAKNLYSERLLAFFKTKLL